MAASSEGQIDSSRLLIPGLAGFYQAVAPYSYAMIRFITGAILAVITNCLFSACRVSRTMW
jgi:hypothetical protein